MKCIRNHVSQSTIRSNVRYSEILHTYIIWVSEVCAPIISFVCSKYLNLDMCAFRPHHIHFLLNRFFLFFFFTFINIILSHVLFFNSLCNTYATNCNLFFPDKTASSLTRITQWHYLFMKDWLKVLNAIYCTLMFAWATFFGW